MQTYNYYLRCPDHPRETNMAITDFAFAHADNDGAIHIIDVGDILGPCCPLCRAYMTIDKMTHFTPLADTASSFLTAIFDDPEYQKLVDNNNLFMRGDHPDREAARHQLDVLLRTKYAGILVRVRKGYYHDNTCYPNKHFGAGPLEVLSMISPKAEPALCCMLKRGGKDALDIQLMDGKLP
jgi:hypothetical protein